MKQAGTRLFIALGGLITIEEDFKASPFIIFIISMPIYIVGIVPTLFLSYEGYEDLKEQTLAVFTSFSH